MRGGRREETEGVKGFGTHAGEANVMKGDKDDKGDKDYETQERVKGAVGVPFGFM